MSNAMIGIKIADGSFYPILEEGKPGEKKLEVTTVRDDQTTVQINLYKSQSGSMEDADYVDTLLIDNLVPHHKEEPSFDLLVKIDENNMLSAEIDDPETGGKSDTKVSLVNMGNKSIFDEPDYKVSTDDMPAVEGEELTIPTETAADNFAGDGADISADTGMDDFSLSDSLSDIPDLDDNQLASGGDDFALPDFDSMEAPQEQSESVAENLVGDDSDNSTDTGVDTGTDDFSLADSLSDIPDLDDNQLAGGGDDFALPDFDSMEAPQEQAESEETPQVADEIDTGLNFDIPEEPVASEPVASDDFSFDMPDEPVLDESVSEAPQEQSEPIAENLAGDGADTGMDDFSLSDSLSDIPDLDDNQLASGGDDFALPDFDSMEAPQEPVAEAVLTDEDFSFSTDFTDDEKDIDEDEKPFSFDSLPDFDEIPELAESSGNSESAMDDDLDIDFSIPEDNDMRKNNYNDTYNNVSDSQPDYNYAPSGNMQSALFGGDDLFEETKKQKERKALVPVIICILCALISLGVLGVILYLTPSIMKLAGGMQSEETAVVATAVPEADSIAAEEEIIVEQPTIRKAEENKIVVLNETVPPVIPETKKEQAQMSSIIKHLVKWGDTLWDLAGFYYRNPWLYRIISDANNLENPDLIISGTYLTIPDR